MFNPGLLEPSEMPHLLLKFPENMKAVEFLNSPIVSHLRSW